MENKNTVSTIIIIIVLVLIGIGAYFLSKPTSEENVTNTSSTYNPQTQGKIIFGITDAALDMEGVSSVFIAVNKVEIHSEAKGWITASNETKEYDLLELKNNQEISLLAEANVDIGVYDQVRLMISKVVVIKNGIQEEAKLPSGELKIMGNFVVDADKSLSVTFDFIADKSLHTTGNDKIIFAPVVKLIKQNDVAVEIRQNNKLNITGGMRENDQNFGMDEKGEVRANFELKGNLDIDIQNIIRLDGDVGIGGIVSEEAKNIMDTIKDSEIELNFGAQNNSGISGTATLSEKDNKVKVSLDFKSSVLGLLSLAQPAHIHVGSCANIGSVKYPLNSAISGKSETMLDVSLANIKASLPLAINVHKSVAESNIYVACVDIKI